MRDLQSDTKDIQSDVKKMIKTLDRNSKLLKMLLCHTDAFGLTTKYM